MDTKSIFKISFSEEYINNMLNKGWKPVEFKGTYGATFEKCLSNKYTCKKVLVDLQFEEDSKEVKNKLEKMSKMGEIEVTPLQYDNCKMLIYYIIYEKDKVISNEILEHSTPIYNDKRYIRRGMGELLKNTLSEIFCVSCYMFIFTVWAIESDSVFYKVSLYTVITIIAILYVHIIFNKVRGMALTLYSRKKMNRKLL